MFGFGSKDEDNRKREEAYVIPTDFGGPRSVSVHDLTEAGNSRQSFGTDIGDAMALAAETIASETPREVIKVADKDTVEFHVANIRGILESVASRRQSLTETRQLRREQFEADDNADADKIAELDRLTAVYRAALATADNDGDRLSTPAPVDPAAAAEADQNPYRSKHPARRRRATTDIENAK